MEIKPRFMCLDGPDKSKWKATIAISAVSMQHHSSFMSCLLHSLPSPSFCSALPLVLISTLSLAPSPELRGGLRIDIQTDTVGRLLLYWRILLVYSLSFLVCSQPLMHSEWLRTNPTEYFGRAFRGQKAFHMKWPTKSVAPPGNKSQRDREAMQKGTCCNVVHYILCCSDESISAVAFGAYSHHADPIDDPHSLLIPFHKSMPSALSSLPNRFFTSWRGREAIAASKTSIILLIYSLSLKFYSVAHFICLCTLTAP